MRTGKVYITLKSDLCVASGYSYAGLVDTDICYDKNGLPYIPARRLKGCFRETAESILYAIIDSDRTLDIFGKAGDAVGGAFSISNARLLNFAKLEEEVRIMKQSGFVNPQKILEQFTHVVAQTEIVEGVANDSSLRYTRVINRYRPYSADENVFVADIFYDEKIEEDLLKIIKATRNIGLKRNRGFGAVKCELKDIEEVKELTTASGTGEEEWELVFTFTNDEPLMLSSMSNIHSEKYVNGQSILGLLAGEYLKIEGNNPDSEEFRDLFLNGKTKYCNAYPSENGKVFYPAPLYYNKLKKTKEIVNTYFDIKKGEEGNQPKKLKGIFVAQDQKEGKITVCGVKEVDMKLHFHNRRNKGKEDGILYSSEAIEPGAEFTGKIIVQEKYKDLLEELLNRSSLKFGKSKGAQYGLCHLSGDVKPEKVKSDELTINAGDELIVTLLSDSVFYGANDYTVDVKEVSNYIASDLGNVKNNESRAKIETGIISGYQNKWNMHKMLVPFIAAGSSFEFEAEKEMTIDRVFFTGKKNTEGFGLVRVDKLKDFKDNSQNEVLSKVSANKPEAGMDLSGLNELKEVYKNILKEQLLTELVDYSLAGDKVVLARVDNTQVGRAILMLKESLATGENSIEQFESMRERVDSIKNEKVKEAFSKELLKPVEKDKQLCMSKLIEDIQHKQSDIDNPVEEIIKQLKALVMVNDDLEKEENSIWGEYLLRLLTNRKYLGGIKNE